MTLGDHLTLDSNIRDWVVLPMVFMMVLVGLGRHFVQQLLKSDTAIKVDDLKNRQVLARASLLRRNGRFLSPLAYQMRKEYFVQKEKGVLRTKVASAANNPMMNPNGMVDMMKNNMTFLIPNMVMMTFISYFFQGFVLVRVPFPLTSRFKVMLQRGIDLKTLDVSYVSSLSWYFLVMFGLRGFFRLILGEDSSATDESRAMQMQMGMGMGGGGGAFDASKAFAQEKDTLNLHRHVYVLGEIEKTILGDKAPIGNFGFPHAHDMPYGAIPGMPPAEAPAPKSIKPPPAAKASTKPAATAGGGRRGKMKRIN